jgi:hypothetical protein
VKLKSLLLGAAALTMAASAAEAKLFTVTWSGAPNGNDGSAVGHFDINVAAVPDLLGNQYSHNIPDPNFNILDVTITGTGAGDGTFTNADFAFYYFAAYGPLDFTKELVGQVMDNGCAFGSFGACYGGPSGDFNLFGNGGNAPSGTFYFQLTTTSGDTLNVTSIAPGGVPEPANWAMLIAGFGLVGAAARQRRVARMA